MFADSPDTSWDFITVFLSQIKATFQYHSLQFFPLIDLKRVSHHSLKISSHKSWDFKDLCISQGSGSAATVCESQSVRFVLRYVVFQCNTVNNWLFVQAVNQPLPNNCWHQSPSP